MLEIIPWRRLLFFNTLSVTFFKAPKSATTNMVTIVPKLHAVPNDGPNAFLYVITIRSERKKEGDMVWSLTYYFTHIYLLV
jgi:hypothetical protein